MKFFNLTLFGVCSLMFVPTASAENQNEFSADSITRAMVIALPEITLPNTWTYGDCVDWASANNTQIRRALLNILSARQDVLSAKDAWLPTVSFGTTQNFTNYPSSASGHNNNAYGSSYAVNGSWTVWEGHVRKYREASAKLYEKQRSLAGADEVMQLKLGILAAYLNILYAKDAVQIATQTLEVSTFQAERAKKLMEAGRNSKVDYAQLESQRALDDYQLTQARSNYETAKMALKKILELGLEYNLSVANVNFTDAEVLAQLPERLEVYNTAAAWLPTLKSNEISKDIYANDVKIAKAGNMPTINLQGSLGTGYNTGAGGWTTQMGHNFNEYVGLNVSVPIFNGNATKRAVAKAEIAEMEYNLTRKNLLDNLSQTIESLYIDSDNARAKYTSGLAQLEAMQMTDDLVNRQFELGYVNPLDLLTAHNNLLNAKLELLQSKYMAILAAKTIGYYATQHVDL